MVKNLVWVKQRRCNVLIAKLKPGWHFLSSFCNSMQTLIQRDRLTETQTFMQSFPHECKSNICSLLAQHFASHLEGISGRLAAKRTFTCLYLSVCVCVVENAIMRTVEHNGNVVGKFTSLCKSIEFVLKRLWLEFTLMNGGLCMQTASDLESNGSHARTFLSSYPFVCKWKRGIRSMLHLWQ